jgi:Sortase domain
MTAGGRPTAGPLDPPRPAPAPRPDQPPAPAPVAPTAAPPGPPDPTPVGNGGPGTWTRTGPDGVGGPDRSGQSTVDPRRSTVDGPAAPSRRRPVRLLVAAGAALAVAAAVTAVTARHEDAPAPARVAAAPAGTAVPAPVIVTPPPRPAVPARPLTVSIPAIGVTSSLLPLHLDAAGALVPPPDFGHAGWYTGGPAPGDQGPAVIAGHVDSRAGPAVFFELRDLRPGDLVTVTRSDRHTARFRVTQVERYPKNAFPRLKVYQPTPDPTLRLITCGGSFDYAKRSYRDNIVVYAVSV